MILISCQKKFHSFFLAEQFEKRNHLSNLYTSYAFQKNTIVRKIVNRIDKEEIESKHIQTNLVSAFRSKFNKNDFSNVNYFDKWVSSKIKENKSAKIFIGWSSMSLYSIREAKRFGIKTILERGSTHIQFQNDLLHNEFKKFGLDFNIDKNIIQKELQEYDETDFISIPSNFVKHSFIKMGIKESKLIVNNYGVSNFFNPPIQTSISKKFTILYLGTISIRKGLIYLFEAISSLDISLDNFEIWFIGAVDQEMQMLKNKYSKYNWKWFGHIPHYNLSNLIQKCDIAIQPSIEEGLSMVIPQILACGVPVIATTNTGAGDIINDNENGFIIPIQSHEVIKEKIMKLYNDQNLLNQMKIAAAENAKKNLQWEDYGKRYINNIKLIL
jgi:glycosyltransferase involved in cell wall biosynthesis